MTGYDIPESNNPRDRIAALTARIVALEAQVKLSQEQNILAVSAASEGKGRRIAELESKVAGLTQELEKERGGQK